MALSGSTSWFATVPREIGISKTTSVTLAALVPNSLLDLDGIPGRGALSLGNTTTGIVPTNASEGFPGFRGLTTGDTLYIQKADLYSTVIASFALYDRLWHAGSINLNSLATTTFSSQPSYAGRLPGTNYAGLEIFLEINAAVSATATTVTVGYTNESGTSGRTTASSGSLSGFGSRRLVPLVLDPEDEGVQRIDSLTVGGVVATTGTVNVIVARRLLDIDTRFTSNAARDLQGPAETGLPIIYPTSALWLTMIPDGTASGVPSLFMGVIEA